MILRSHSKNLHNREPLFRESLGKSKIFKEFGIVVKMRCIKKYSIYAHVHVSNDVVLQYFASYIFLVERIYSLFEISPYCIVYIVK